jgi:hypothetical protein
MSISQFLLLAIRDRLSFHYDNNLERYSSCIDYDTFRVVNGLSSWVLNGLEPAQSSVGSLDRPRW